MNTTERDQLQQFLSALRQTRADPKDPVADALIREAVANQADAPYLLVQRAMGLGLALDAAQARIGSLEAQCAQLQTQLQAAQAAQMAAPAPSGFLTSGVQAWGRGADTPAAQAPSPVATPLAPRTVGAQNLGTGMATSAAPQPGASAWGGGLMAQVASTAAGVVAGGLLFQGVQSLMGHHSQTPSPSSPVSHAPEEALPGQVSPLASADPIDDGDASWGETEDWA